MDGQPCCGNPIRRPESVSEETGIAAYLPFSNVPPVLYFGAVVLALMLAPHLAKRGELLTDGVAFIAGAAWCGINARRGGHAHCLITSVGWVLLGAGVFAEAWLGRSLIQGDEQLVFVGILIAGLAFECLWYSVTGSNRLRRPPSRGAPGGPSGQPPPGISAPDGSPAST